MKVASHPDRRFRAGPVATIDVDARAVRQRLEAELEGEVRFRPGDRALYATAGSNYRYVPIGVVIPKTVEDVLATLAACREHAAPVLARGAGTSLAGQSSNFAVIIDFSKYLNRIVALDAERKLARVEPGVILDHLRNEANKHGLTFGPDPSTHESCTIGGMIGNNACGIHSVMSQFYGPGPLTADNVAELDVVMYRGDRFRVGETSEDELARIVAAQDAQGAIYAKLLDLRDRVGDLVRARFPQIPRRVSGYNLDRLLPENGFDVAGAITGTESTCVTVLGATLHLIDNPPRRSLLVVGYEDAADAADQVPTVLEHEPLGLEGVDDVLLEDMALVHLHDEELSMIPDGRGFLLIEFGGDSKEEADEKAHAVLADLQKDRKHQPTGWRLYDDPKEERHVWDVREAGLGATAFIPGKSDTYEGWEDSAVPPERVGEYIRELRKLAARYDYESALYGHYGQGCIHARWNFDLQTKEGIAKFRRFLDDASDLVLSLGGSLSGEHGDGQARAELLPKMFGEELVEAFREFKSIWDPDWKMNPGKVVDPYRITDNLRLGPDWAPIAVEPHFAYPDDGGSFAHATVRCVGIGKCRRTEGGVMCPSYMVLRDEKHTTRGRARILFEMLNGDPVEGVWRNDEVLEALDLCLACKGCTNDCPVSVDLPILKAEFLAHRYAGRLRPRHAYAFGLIDQAARMAAHAPRLVNFVTGTPPLSRLAKVAAGMAPERGFPAFAPLTLRDWFAARGPRNHGGKKVIVWADTFNNHFDTDVGVAAVEALEAAGYHVALPEARLCCGRPLYDYGFLGLARRYLDRTLDALRDETRAGTPVIVIEPSCLAVFRDELGKLMPNDEDAKRLAKQAFHFGEFLEREGYEPPPLPRKILLHGHCHHKATGGIASEQKLLEQMGAGIETPDSGCCGLAGSWGYEAEHYDLSLACGERVLLPAARQASADTLLVADGFSCRTQIEHGTGRRPLHIAQVLALAQTGAVPEQPRGAGGRRLLAGAALAAAAGGALLAARHL